MKKFNEKKLAKLALGDYLKQLKVWEIFAKAANMICGYETTNKQALEIKETPMDVAMTDGDTIFVNIDNDITAEQDSNKEKTLSLLGLIAHEAGHIRHSDFELLRNIHDTIVNKGRMLDDYIFEKRSFLRTEDWEINFPEIQKALKESKQTRYLFASLVCQIMNIFEDEWMEKEVKFVYHGDVTTAMDMNCSVLSKKHIEESIPNAETEVAKLFNILMAIVRCHMSGLGYYGKDWDTFADDVKCIAEGTVRQSESVLRYHKIIVIITHAWPLIKDEIVREDDGEGESTGGESSEEGDSSSSSSSSSEGSDEGEDGSDSSSDSSSKQTSSDEEGKGEEPKSDSPDTKEGEEDSEEVDGSDSSKDSDTSSSTKPSFDDLAKEIDSLSEDAKRMLDMALDDEFMGKLEELRKEASDGKPDEDVSEILSSELSEEGREAKVLQKEADSVKVNDMHKHARCKVVTDIESANKALEERSTAPRRDYKAQLKNNASYYKLLKRNLEPLFIEEDEVNEGVYFGDKLSEKHLFSAEDKHMLKEELASEERKLSIGVLVDQSGSMSSGDRTKPIREFSIMLFEVCRELNIPLAIWGHGVSANREFYKGHTILPVYCDFDKHSKKEEDNLAKMNTLWCDNRDGYAIHLFGNHLAKRSEEHKLLIILSDGQPADCTTSSSFSAPHYFGGDLRTREDMKDVVGKLKKDGITVFAGAIGDDKERIKEIYGENKYLDLTDFKTLPKKLCRLIQRQVI